MFDSLARLANRRPRRVALAAIVFFLLAGALGGSVADRLDPYGADDPATEAVRARTQLDHAGNRIPGVVIVVADAPVAKVSTRRRVKALERELGARGDVASVSSYYTTGSRDFVA